MTLRCVVGGTVKGDKGVDEVKYEYDGHPSDE